MLINEASTESSLVRLVSLSPSSTVLRRLQVNVTVADASSGDQMQMLLIIR